MGFNGNMSGPLNGAAITYGACGSRTSPALTARATLARPLHPAALASVPYGVVLVRVRVRVHAWLRTRRGKSITNTPCATVLERLRSGPNGERLSRTSTLYPSQQARRKVRLPGAAATPAHTYAHPTPARKSWMSARRDRQSPPLSEMAFPLVCRSLYPGAFVPYGE
jgi:hypothetical protein